MDRSLYATTNNITYIAPYSLVDAPSCFTLKTKGTILNVQIQFNYY